MRNSACLVLAASFMVGCASAPTISELNHDVAKVVLVENGTAPLTYTTGVIDTSSFWAAYGSGVSTQLGGGTLWQGLEQSGKSEAAAKAQEHAEMVKKLLGSYPLAAKINSAILPQLAAAWSTPYDAKAIVKLADKPAYIDSKTQLLQGVDTDADLILMTEIGNVNLTERFSMGGALTAGFTMGANKKALTTEVRVALRAFKRELASAGYKQVWFHLCGPNYTTMKTSYYLDELAQSPDKMNEILDEATTQAVEGCTKALDTFSKANMTARGN